MLCWVDLAPFARDRTLLVTVGCSSASHSKGDRKIHIVNVALEVEPPTSLLAGEMRYGGATWGLSHCRQFPGIS